MAYTAFYGEWNDGLMQDCGISIAYALEIPSLICAFPPVSCEY